MAHSFDACPPDRTRPGADAAPLVRLLHRSISVLGAAAAAWLLFSTSGCCVRGCLPSGMLPANIQMRVEAPSQVTAGDRFPLVIRFHNREISSYSPQFGLVFSPNLDPYLAVESTVPPSRAGTQGNGPREYHLGDRFFLNPGTTEVRVNMRALQAGEYNGTLSLFINQEDGELSQPVRITVAPVASSGR
jgi:hypothetical protein